MKKIALFILSVLPLGVLLCQYNPLPIPPLLTGPIYNLNIQHGVHDFNPLDTIPPSTNTMGYNGNILGPTLKMQAGQRVQMNVTNSIGEPTTVHWHNLHVSSENDGGPHSIIEPNTTWSPSFIVDDKAATFWYHPHPHHEAANQIWRGLAGVIIVNDSEESALNLPRTYGVDDFPLVLQGRKIFGSDGDVALMDVFNAIPNVPKEPLRTVNGVDSGNLVVPKQMVRFRMVNGAQLTVFEVGLSNNANFYQIGTDGGLLQTRYETNRVRLAPGERAEIVVDFSSYPTGSQIKLKSYAQELPRGVPGAIRDMMNISATSGNSWVNSFSNFYDGNYTLVTFTVGTTNATPVTSIPTNLVTLSRLSEASATNTRSFYFHTNGTGGPKICTSPNPSDPDCDGFSMNEIDQLVNLNAIEVWTLHGGVVLAHPFHLHGGQYFILEKRDSANNIVPLLPNELGRKDVVLVKKNDKIKIIRHFDDFGNDVPYMYHCHITPHEDKGMMQQLVVKKEIFVNKNYTGPENGSQTNPFNTTAEAVTAATDGATIVFISNMDHEELGTLIATTKRITFKPSTGSVTIK
jgi:blue copper oxidase